jgi:hypothetical protein
MSHSLRFEDNHNDRQPAMRASKGHLAGLRDVPVMHNNVYRMPSSRVEEEVPELRRLYQAIQDFRESMEGDLPLSDFDRVCLENYIALLQITYMEWKRRNYRPPACKKAA